MTRSQVDTVKLRQDILAYMGTGIFPTVSIALELGLTRKQVYPVLCRMEKSGLLERKTCSLGYWKAIQS